MRIDLLSAAPFPPSTSEGIANFVYNLSRNLVQKEHEVTVSANIFYGVNRRGVMESKLGNSI
jgi:hypothetical protein